MSSDDEGLNWQIGVWNQMSRLYGREVDRRFSPVVEALIRRASLRPGERVLDLGTGTGAVAVRAAVAVGAAGSVVGIDISQEMLRQARQATASLDLQNVDFTEGRAEAIPAEAATFDVVLASLSLMFVIDRAAAAREIARVLRPGGRFVAAIWSRSGIQRYRLVPADGRQFCASAAGSGRRTRGVGRSGCFPCAAGRCGYRGGCANRSSGV